MFNGISESQRAFVQVQHKQGADDDQWRPGPGGILVPKTPRPAQYASNRQRMSEAEEANMDQPVPNDQEGWERYWSERGQPWRWEPEIPKQRQEELEQRRDIESDWEQGIYPFGGMTLTRADIEWLLATHEGGRGPIDWSKKAQRTRKGLDLRGVRVEERTNLALLSLTKLLGGIGKELTEVQQKSAMLDFSQCDLHGAKLEGADLYRARLKRVNLCRANLKNTDLREATLESANLREATLEGANLHGVILADAQGIGPILVDIRWEGTSLTAVNWGPLRKLGSEHLARQSTTKGREKKDHQRRQSEYQEASRANHQLSVVLQDQGLTESASHFAYLSKCTKRKELWYRLWLTQEEWKRRFQANPSIPPLFRSLKAGWLWIKLWIQAALKWVGSYLLFVVSGYGYRVWQCIVWYVVIVGVFTILYHFLEPHVLTSWSAAAAESVNVFHGRGAAPNVTIWHNPALMAKLNIIEAVLGLMMEVIFVATMLQRLFGK